MTLSLFCYLSLQRLSIIVYVKMNLQSIITENTAFSYSFKHLLAFYWIHPSPLCCFLHATGGLSRVHCNMTLALILIFVHLRQSTKVIVWMNCSFTYVWENRRVNYYFILLVLLIYQFDSPLLAVYFIFIFYLFIFCLDLAF